MDKAGKTLLAHVKENNSDWVIHSLEEHLFGVADYANKFAKKIGLEKIAQIQALVHDIGKASEDFQQKIAGLSGYDPEAHVNSAVDHSTAGAQYLNEKYGEGAIPLAYSMMGHHGGLPNGYDEWESCLKKRLKKDIPEYKENKPEIELPQSIIPSDFVPVKCKKPLKVHMLIRLLYSILTDADFLDTEQFMSPEKVKLRKSSEDDFFSLKQKIDKDLAAYTETTGVNSLRSEILRWCKTAAGSQQGIFSLTVPTGGGKTKSSVAFAIDHCIKHDLDRIIYVVPYTSIISQNAAVFRSIFGEDVVLEHHSNLEPELETARNRLICENWDVPLVVTTNVQFFESFYSNKSSSCRKLHNVSNSVIIFDEAQMLPTGFLKPCLEIISELVDNYGCTAVLCTATQPTLNNKKFLKKSALEKVTEIIPEPVDLYQKLKRVHVSCITEPLKNENVSDRVLPLKQVLIIVNTRRDARSIFESIRQKQNKVNEVFHLSTLMCPKHREETLKTIRKRISQNLPCKVVSTQLIEAGVDIDFPVVYRAIAGLDSIAQAAGRCNREGKLECGDVFVFKGENQPPPGHLRHSAESGEKTLQKFGDDPLCLDAIDAYFEDFYWKRAGIHGMDSKDIVDRLNVNPDKIDQIPFKDIAKDFSIISQPTKAVIIPYGPEGEALVRRLQDHYYFPDKKDYKEAQRLSVQVMDKIHEKLVGMGAVVDARGDGQFFILSNIDIYNMHTGLSTDDPQFIESEKLVF
jgi:CRISPR-associated endonuclease/helicase Cas3